MATTKRRYRSDALESAHSAAAGLHKIGVIDKTTMRYFDLACLTQVDDLKPKAIRSIRTKAKMSQSTFAAALNVPISLVSQWERGEKKPSGPSLKLLALVKNKGIDAIL